MYVGEAAVSMVCAPCIVGAVPGGREVPTGCPAARLQSGLDVGAGFLSGHRGLPVTPNRTPEPAGAGWGSWAAPRRVAAGVALLEPVAQGSQKQAPRVRRTLRRPAGEASGAARSPGLPGKRAERRGGRPRARLTLCVAQAGAQQRRRHARSFSFPVCEGKPFQLWALGLCSTERHLARRLKRNSFYPFTQVQPHVFALEYYRDSLWKGTLLFVVCFLLVSFNIVSQVQKQETWGLPACGMVVGLWLVVSSLPRRRLLLHCKRGYYHFSIQGHTVYQGPMHLIYVRLALSSDVHGKCFFQLVLSGYKLEPLVLVQLSERYELMEYLGRHIAQKLNINYFDCLALSYRHVVRHWPLSPYIGKREHKKEGFYSSVTDLDL